MAGTGKDSAVANYRARVRNAEARSNVVTPPEVVAYLWWAEWLCATPIIVVLSSLVLLIWRHYHSDRPFLPG